VRSATIEDMSLIELKNLTKQYKTGDTITRALRDINLVVNEGEFVSIIGPSGSGKSTLMHILGLLDSPTSGEYLLDGQRMDNRKDRQLAGLRRDLIGFVFQSFNLLNRLSVLQNVMLPMAYAGLSTRKRKQRALELLKRVGIADRANHKINQISGGQTQRVAVARSLANNPRLILADEPTGNLDTKSSDNIIALLKELNNEGNTIIIVTHNPEIAERTDRIIEIRDGQIVRDAQTSSKPASTRAANPKSTKGRVTI
jgi:putative ABC transport system ATP-binding protein